MRNTRAFVVLVIVLAACRSRPPSFTSVDNVISAIGEICAESRGDQDARTRGRSSFTCVPRSQYSPTRVECTIGINTAEKGRVNAISVQCLNLMSPISTDIFVDLLIAMKRDVDRSSIRTFFRDPDPTRALSVTFTPVDLYLSFERHSYDEGMPLGWLHFSIDNNLLPLTATRIEGPPLWTKIDGAYVNLTPYGLARWAIAVLDDVLNKSLKAQRMEAERIFMSQPRRR